MDTLDDSEWDVLISGTGIQQSLLALALSRSDKKVLHIDKNDYYGGAEAAFSLQEAEAWVKRKQLDGHSSSTFVNASISAEIESDSSDASPKLSFSRAYSLALAPELIYADSKLLPSLVSSKTYRQLEFVAMGSWFVYNPDEAQEDDAATGTLLKIPTTREDLVFSDKSIDIRSKRAVMKVLRFLMEYETQEEVWQPYAEKPFAYFLQKHFKLPEKLHGLFYALTLSLSAPQQTTTALALPRIARHLRTTGHFGPGFNSVIPKWGGLSEIAQVACRAGAVGGAVYVLNKGLKLTPATNEQESKSAALSDDEKIKVSWIVGDTDNLPEVTTSPARDHSDEQAINRSITIVSTPLTSLFPPLAEGAPPPAGAVVVFPARSLTKDSLPVYLIIHSSDTGECPQGQSIVYALTRGSSTLLDQVMNRLTTLVDETPAPLSLWCLKYEQRIPTSARPTKQDASSRTITFPSPSVGLAFDEDILVNVKSAWQKILGPEAESDEFLVFEDRNQVGEDDEDD